MTPRRYRIVADRWEEVQELDGQVWRTVEWRTIWDPGTSLRPVVLAEQELSEVIEAEWRPNERNEENE